MKVTRILNARKPNPGKFAALCEQAQRLGPIRSEVWHRFGSIQGVKRSDRQICDQWLKDKRVFPVSANARRCIWQHTQDKIEQQHLFTALKRNDWINARYLRRVMRHAWKRGHTHTHNQIIVRSDNYTTFQLNGCAWIKIPGLVKGQRMAIALNTTIEPTGTLRIILKDDDSIEIHTTIEAEITQDCGTRTLGIDKGYSEVLVDSAGESHGQELGALLATQSDRLKATTSADPHCAPSPTRPATRASATTSANSTSGAKS